MRGMANSINQTEILLETGTNELEIMEFTVAGEVYGINVAKVREIMKFSPVKKMQQSHPSIEGGFKPRDDVITVIDLAHYLGLPPSENNERDIFIVANFNNLHFAFHVHSVVGIDRISWQNINKPDRIIYGGDEGMATGIASFQDRLITILDFEKIITEISPESSIQFSEVQKLGERVHNEKPILVAEDSMLLAKLLVEALNMAGYTNIIRTDNGAEAWDVLTGIKAASSELGDQIACVISDIEMPKMDGHRLTKLIKEDPFFKGLPVILFSSMINEEMRLKGKALGADAQISKPEIANLVLVLDNLLA